MTSIQVPPEPADQLYAMQKRVEVAEMETIEQRRLFGEAVQRGDLLRDRAEKSEAALAASAAQVKALEGERDAALGVGDGFRNETYELRARAEAAEARVRVLETAAAHAHEAPTAFQAVECPAHHKSWGHCAHGHSEYVCDLCCLACRDWVAANRAHEAANLGGTK